MIQTTKATLKGVHKGYTKRNTSSRARFAKKEHGQEDKEAEVNGVEHQDHSPDLSPFESAPGRKRHST
ncbi:MAG: hypothetical protein ABSF90_29890, partial [Syntrophobacteraceae bacterium]